MYEWQRQIQSIVDEIDESIQAQRDEALTLRALARRLGYSEFYTTRKFREIAGMPLKDYLRLRRLAFALKEVRDSQKSLLEIAVGYGFSSHEAFTRAFKQTYGVTPSEYRKKPVPLVLRTRIHPFDRYFFGMGEIGMMQSKGDVKIYFVTIPAHKFLHIKNYESNGYGDFWQKQSQIPGQDCATICGLLDSIQGKLDDNGGSDTNSGAGQLMAYINDPAGRLCDWGIPRTECYGVRKALCPAHPAAQQKSPTGRGKCRQGQKMSLVFFGGPVADRPAFLCSVVRALVQVAQLLGLLDHAGYQVLRQHLVASELGGEPAAALGGLADKGGQGLGLGQRHLGDDGLQAVFVRLHAQHAAAALGHIAHHVAGVLVGHMGTHRVDGLQDDRAGLRHGRLIG